MFYIFFEGKIEKLEIDYDIIIKLNNNAIYTINDLWNLSRRDLKKLKLTDGEINQIIVKMQLYGIDLNRRIYHAN
jgi:DNA-directed RNA polymerase alpha subunit